MTKDQIKAELRREAEKYYPLFGCLHRKAYHEAKKYLPDHDQYEWDDKGNIKRTFFLLVAEAL